MYIEFPDPGSKFHQFHPKILQYQTNSASQKCRHHVNFNVQTQWFRQYQPLNAHFNPRTLMPECQNKHITTLINEKCKFQPSYVHQRPYKCPNSRFFMKITQIYQNVYREFGHWFLVPPISPYKPFKLKPIQLVRNAGTTLLSTPKFNDFVSFIVQTLNLTLVHQCPSVRTSIQAFPLTKIVSFNPQTLTSTLVH